MTVISYVVSHGFAARMVVHSRVIPLLKEQGISVVLLVPEGDTAYLNSMAEERGFRVEVIPTGALSTGHLSAWIRPYLFEDVSQNPALRAKHLRAVERLNARGLAARAFFVVNRAACHITWLRKGLVRWQRKKLRSKIVEEIIQKVQPAVVVSTYPVNDLEASVLLEAQRARIRTVGQLLSWDNITAKGRWLVVPDFFLVWGPIMAEEVMTYYGVDEKRIKCTGVPHFDEHATNVSPEGIAAAVARLGLEPQKPYLFFGMSAPFFAPTEIDIVEKLAATVENNRFGQDMQLVVRPHPQNIVGEMADPSWLSRLKALQTKRVGVNYPTLVESSLPWEMERGDLLTLANLIGGCSVCLNSGSTLSIEAIIHDKPVVLPLFDLGKTFPWHKSVKRVGEYIHQRKFIELGGVAVADSFDSLVRKVEIFLKDPAVNADGRQRVREKELGLCIGRASEKTAAALKSLLPREKSEAW